MASKRSKPKQALFDFKPHGGTRKGAGRKRQGPRKKVVHRRREDLPERFPVHVTSRVQSGLPNLRGRLERKVLQRAFQRGAERFGFRLVHFSIQTNHVHLVAEADDRTALSRGMQGLKIRVAKALNRLWQRCGAVFEDRFHARLLRTPREVKNALVYVLRNHAHHGLHLVGLDACSSARWFDGWREQRGDEATPFARARSWLLRVGWKRWGLASVSDLPRATRSQI